MATSSRCQNRSVLNSLSTGFDEIQRNLGPVLTSAAKTAADTLQSTADGLVTAMEEAERSANANRSSNGNTSASALVKNTGRSSNLSGSLIPNASRAEAGNSSHSTGGGNSPSVPANSSSAMQSATPASTGTAAVAAATTTALTPSSPFTRLLKRAKKFFFAILSFLFRNKGKIIALGVPSAILAYYAHKIYVTYIKPVREILSLVAGGNNSTNGMGNHNANGNGGIGGSGDPLADALSGLGAGGDGKMSEEELLRKMFAGGMGGGGEGFQF